MSRSTTSQDTPLVSLFFVGVGKCGTSWLYEFLRSGDAVSVPQIKEPYLIDMAPDERDLAVERLYSPRDQMRADFSNLYYWDADNPGKVRDYNPDARIVLTVRRPSERAASHFKFLLRNGLVPDDDFAAYLAAGDDHAVVKRSDYQPMLDRYQQTFGSDRVLVLPLEELRADPAAYVQRLSDFVGVDLGPVGDQDSRPVLAAAAPRNRRIAKTAWQVGQVLRRAGLLRLLSTFKRSSAVQRLLFRDAGDDTAIISAARSHPRLGELDASYPSFVDR